jgi:hypothetical protein
VDVRRFWSHARSMRNAPVHLQSAAKNSYKCAVIRPHMQQRSFGGG